MTSPAPGYAVPWSLPALLAEAGGTFWLPPQSSSTARYVDAAFHLVLGISTFFFLLIVALMVVFVLRYRRRPGVGPAKSPSHSTALEITWSVIPLGLVVVIFSLGFYGYMEIRTAPRTAYEILVTAQKWKWTFRYPNGYEDPELHVPVDEPVRLVMQSQDVIHSLFIPAFRLKMDVVPGRYTTTWFRAIAPGEYDLTCTEYCGTGHSDMVTKVVVHAPGEFEPWLRKADEQAQSLAPVDAGRRLVTQRCASCHSVDGTQVPNGGPSFKGIFGQTHTFTKGPPQVVDENYLRESILDPSKRIREGYEDRMSTFRGQLTDKQITNIIEYIKSLK
ncbi:MAG: cytochrome c oxidase subunit II [Thermoguttaceae bacterium]|jgi:cytochrome c oxidase subunit 2|nr:cytochrome c oxidase subunit II [Thermoguttaceae bacterium]